MVLFTSNRSLDRAENIKAVYSAYDGDKKFIKTDPWKWNPEIASSKYKVRVTDEFLYLTSCKTIMIGHGLSGGKSYGLEQPHPYHRQENAKFLTYVIATSEAMRELVARQSGVSVDKVLALGMPRTDAYFGKKKGDGKTILAKKRAYLYAPTFRNANEPRAPEIDWEFIDSKLTDDEILIVKPHMITRHILRTTYRNVIEVSADEPSTPYLIDCDVLITDYSSIMMDAHILEKPVILFEKEKGYVETRGMTLKYPDEYASRYCTNEMELIKEMRNAFGQNEEDIRCRELTAGACDGHSSERVIQLIKDIL